MKIADQVYNKTQEVLFVDKIKSPQKISGVLSGEIFYVLKQFFEINENTYDSKIFMEDDGELNISFSFRAKRVLVKRGLDTQ